MPVVLAHTYHEAGTISSQIHVSPEDTPKVNEASYIHTQITDVSGNFRPENCECYIKVFKNNEEMFSFPYDDIINIEFPQKGIYTIEFTGVPKNGASFEEFKFTHEVRVEENENYHNIPPQMPFFICVCVLAFLVVGFGIFKYVKRKH